MLESNRRSFLKHVSLGVAAMSAQSSGRVAVAGEANDRIVVGVIGCGRHRGNSHGRSRSCRRRHETHPG